MDDPLFKKGESRLKCAQRWCQRAEKAEARVAELETQNDCTETSTYRLVDHWGDLKLEYVRGPVLRSPNKVHVGGMSLEFSQAGRGREYGHGFSGPAIVGLEVEIGGRKVFLHADELEFSEFIDERKEAK
jgi:hypothetical protein